MAGEGASGVVVVAGTRRCWLWAPGVEAAADVEPSPAKGFFVLGLLELEDDTLELLVPPYITSSFGEWVNLT